MPENNIGQPRTNAPDPTSLTTQQLIREVGALKELMETRLEGMDKAIVLLQAFADRQPTTEAVALEVKSLKELALEKFAGVTTQFSERDKALNAALQAAKESVGESNKSFTKQIDALGTLLSATTGGLADKIEDLRGRLIISEGRREGSGNTVNWVAVAIGTLVAVAGLVLAFTQ